MAKKQCYYQVLGLPSSATEEEIKRAYRQLARSHHPDKNPDRTDEAKAQFLILQQAYDVLSDLRERAFYDRHKEAILRGNNRDDIVDENFDVIPFFSCYCYSSFDDSDNGFYTVYREVFEKIAEEDRSYKESTTKSEEENPPCFGTSTSPYSEVHQFYAYWQSYCTSKSFVWLDKYNILDAPNRRVARLIEKENKKIRDAAKKKRNEEIRVSF